MKKIKILSLFLVLTVCFSCEENGWIADCSHCTPEEPDMTTLVVKLKDIGIPVRVNIYEGEVEDSVLYDFADSNLSEYNPAVKLNKRYSLTATYYIEGHTYVAIDAVTPKVKYTKDQCDEPCYYVYDRVADLRLKYTAKGD